MEDRRPRLGLAIVSKHGSHLKRGDRVTGWRETYSLRIGGLAWMFMLWEDYSKATRDTRTDEELHLKHLVFLFCECVLNYHFQVSLGAYEQP